MGARPRTATRPARAGVWFSGCSRPTARYRSGIRATRTIFGAGLVAAIGAALPGASWQRCRTHYLRNLLTKVTKSAQPWIATLVRTIFDQPDADAVRAQFGRVVTTIEAKFPAAAEHLDAARDDLLAFTAFPRQIWRQIWSNNPQERLNKEIRRRTDVVGILPNRAAIIRLVGAVLAEQTDEWTEGRRYMGLELLAKARLITIDTDQHDNDQTEVPPVCRRVAAGRTPELLADPYPVVDGFQVRSPAHGQGQRCAVRCGPSLAAGA